MLGLGALLVNAFEVGITSLKQRNPGLNILPAPYTAFCPSSGYRLILKVKPELCQQGLAGQRPES